MSLVTPMKQWQYLLGDDVWVNCSPENCELLQARLSNPTLEPIFLQNKQGLLWGTPENNQMKFRFNHENETIHKSTVRIGIQTGEVPIHVIEYRNLNNIQSHLLIPPQAQTLLTHIANKPTAKEQLNVQIGTECLVAFNGKIWMETVEGLAPCRYGLTNLSYWQFRDITRSRYSWIFKGPFRKKRMYMAVRKTALTLPEEEQQELLELYDHLFDAADDAATEYGPYQFQDFLIARGRFTLATTLMDIFHQIDCDEWKPFSATQNSKIESCRQRKLPGVKLNIGGEIFLILFESGAGSSGSNAVLIRPSRYNKILNTIEEQFEENCLRDLFNALLEIGIHPVSFLNAENQEDLLTPTQSITIRPLLHKAQHPAEYMGTRIQQVMPALLNKFKECEIKMTTEESINAKNLCPTIASTMQTGLSVPIGQTQNFQEMITFIHRQQSWIVPTIPTAVKQCNICLETDSSCTLSHCGTNGACLKCWCDSLIANHFKCPFCRQEVDNGQLCILIDPASTVSPTTVSPRRSKRRKTSK